MTGDNDKANENDENKSISGETGETEALALQNNIKDQASDSKEKPSTPEVTAKPKTNKKTGSIVILILLLLMLSALAVGGYFAWQFWNQYSATQEQRITALENATAQQGSQVQTLASVQAENTEGQSEILNAIQASQEAIQQRLDSHTQRIRALAGTSRDDWLLAEARYLLRLASQRLLVERGTDGARALLESADSILLSVDDSGVLPVRSAIANEVIALKLAKTVDRQGLYLELAAIKQQIQALPLIPFRPTAEAISTDNKTVTQNDSVVESTWYDSVWNSVKNAFSNLGRFVQIRSHDQAPELLVTEKQQLQTINHLMLMFEQAQFALLHEEEMIYRNSLEEAMKWWDNYYSHYGEHEIIRSEIKSLQNKNIIQTLPDISRSLELLTDYIERFHKLNKTTKTTPAKESPQNNATVEDTPPAINTPSTGEPQS